MKKQKSIERKDNITIIYPQNHKHTLIWIHGLSQTQDTHLESITQATKNFSDCLKIVAPRAPYRFVTVKGEKTNSWFDIKFRNEKSFVVPFDEAFSSHEVIDSFQNVLKPIIVQESQKVKKEGGKLVISGFSQGCGMSLHSLYSVPYLIDAAVGIAGYLFPFTKFDASISDVSIVYGHDDNLRPWEFVKQTYKGKIESDKISFIKGMKHEINSDTVQVLTKKFNKIFGVPSPHI